MRQIDVHILTPRLFRLALRRLWDRYALTTDELLVLSYLYTHGPQPQNSLQRRFGKKRIDRLRSGFRLLQFHRACIALNTDLLWTLATYRVFRR